MRKSQDKQVVAAVTRPERQTKRENNHEELLCGFLPERLSVKRILVIESVPQSEEPGALLLGFTLSFSMGTLLKHTTQWKMIHVIRSVIWLCFAPQAPFKEIMNDVINVDGVCSPMTSGVDHMKGRK